MSDVARNLPAEFDPDSWPIGDRTASCMQQVPINQAYQDLDDCYQNGADLTSCRTKVNYDTIYNDYQQCIAGKDLGAVVNPSSVVNAPSLVSYAQTVAQPAIPLSSSIPAAADKNISANAVESNNAQTILSSSNVSTGQGINKTFLWIMIALQSVNLLACIAIIVLAYISSASK